MVSGTGSQRSTLLVECVPNFSEGRRAQVMDEIQAAAESVTGAHVLDRHADEVHNRMVLTIVGTAGPVAEATFRAAARATQLIDLDKHQGVHPRIGATDVGARQPLIAYNVTLATGDLELARSIARSIRESSGGLPAVQARGFRTADPNVVQVSMNLLDTRRTPMTLVFERIADEAGRH